MRIFPFGIILAVSVAVAGCSSRTVTKERPVTVKVPVSAPCVSNWPQKPPPLPDGSHWAQMDTRMKAAAIGAHAIHLRNYADNLAAATAGCREVK